jgi:archaellum component FlaC
MQSGALKEGLVIMANITLEEQVARTSRRVEETSLALKAYGEKIDRDVEESRKWRESVGRTSRAHEGRTGALEMALQSFIEKSEKGAEDLRKRQECTEEQVTRTERMLQVYGERLDRGMEDLRKRQECTEEQVQRTETQLERTSRTLAEGISRVERALADSIEKSNREMEEFRKRHEVIDAEIKNMIRESSEYRQVLAEERREADEKFWKLLRDESERMEEFRNRMDKLDGEVGGIGSRFGDIVEIFIIPGIRPAVNKIGHNFKRVFPNKVVKNAENFKVTQVDALLTDGAEAMAVEVKSHWSSTAYVDQHVRRLEKLRRYEVEAGVKGKALYGAVAGILIDKRVNEYAKKHGMYVVEIVENKNLLKVRAPKEGQIRTW